MSTLATDSRTQSQVPVAPPAAGRGALYAGGLAAILASACCLGPLALLMLGVSGAWIGTLTALEPYRPFFIVVAVVALAFAYRQVFRPAAACAPGDVCAVPQVRTTYKALFGLVAVLILIAISYPYIAPLFY
jgi:mercuric ion transport protein